MQSSELHRSVARATGESLAAVRRRGFSLLAASCDDVESDSKPGSDPVDWDALEAERSASPHPPFLAFSDG